MAQQLISLCMIARDNERTIGDAIRSARPWFDEMIVVDTGSVDKTPDIAKELGARVEYFKWCDDFSAARNQSLRYATCDWIFWMDTDDTLPEHCGRHLRQTIAAEIPDDVLGFVMQVHCPSGNHSPTKLSEKSTSSSQKLYNDNSCTVVDHVKVVRNRPDLAFEGRIHEQLLPSIRRAGGDVRWMDAFVVHSGVDHSLESVQKKLSRDLRLLRLDIQDRPENSFVLFNLGMTLLHAGELKEAKERLENCICLGVTGESHVRKAYSLLSDVFDGLGLEERALRTCWEGLGRYPDDPELSFKLGRLLMLQQDWTQAIDAFSRAARPADKRFFSSVDFGIKGHKTYANMATCFLNLGQLRESLGAWRKAIQSCPSFVDAWKSVLSISREINEYGILDQVAQDYVKVDGAATFAQVSKALLLGANGRIDDAIEQFEIARVTTTEKEFVLDEYARFLNEKSRWKLLQSVLEELCAIAPENPSAFFNLGVCLQQLKKPSEATKALHEANRLRPNHDRTLQLLSECASASASVQLDDCSDLPTERVLITTLARPTLSRSRSSDNLESARKLIAKLEDRFDAFPLPKVVFHENGFNGLLSSNLTFYGCDRLPTQTAGEFLFAALFEYLENRRIHEQVFYVHPDESIIDESHFQFSENCELLAKSYERLVGQSKLVHDQWTAMYGVQIPDKIATKPLLTDSFFGGSRITVLELCDRIMKQVQVLPDVNGCVVNAVFNCVAYGEFDAQLNLVMSDS